MNKNVCYIASAGAGKTTYIIKKSYETLLENNSNNVAIITFTTKNQDNIRKKVSELPVGVFKKIHIFGWYEFLLKYIIRPYKGTIIPDLYSKNVGMLWSEANKSIKRGKFYIPRYKEGDFKTKYLYKNKIYKNYLSEFANDCIIANNPNCIKRLEKIFSHIFIDEAQDLAGHDLEVIKSICESKISLTIVADPRQRTYTTNNLRKHKKYSGKIDTYLEKEVNKRNNKIIDINYNTLNVSHRCNSEICKVASSIHLDYSPTIPCNCNECKELKLKNYNGLCKVFWVKECSIQSFIEEFDPIALTRHRTKTIHKLIKRRMTMGESKGLGNASVIIYPTTNMLLFLKNKKLFDETEMARLYVALTRATNVVGIVVPNNFISSCFNLDFWES